MANEKDLLAQGADTWNEWRANNPEIKLDLRGIDLRGTDLRWTNLSAANLSNADLRWADLRGAYLSRADLRWADLRGTNFSGANLSRADLRGTNLSGANLGEAALSGADLSRAELSGADLSGADLSGADLESIEALYTNFNRAILTGAYIQNWDINRYTKLKGAICDYIYLKHPAKERRPNSGNFAPGEFIKLFHKVFETVELTFLKGIEWQAFLTSFQKLQRLQINSEKAELSIQAIEKKPDGTFVIRVNIPANANRAEIEQYLKQEYELQLQAINENYRNQLINNDKQIELHRRESAKLEIIVEILASRLIINNPNSEI